MRKEKEEIIKLLQEMQNNLIEEKAKTKNLENKIEDLTHQMRRLVNKKNEMMKNDEDKINMNHEIVKLKKKTNQNLHDCVDCIIRENKKKRREP